MMRTGLIKNELNSLPSKFSSTGKRNMTLIYNTDVMLCTLGNKINRRDVLGYHY